MKQIFILFSIIIFTSAHSQIDSKFEKYDRFAWNAMIQFKEKDYKNSLKNFQKTLKIIPNDSDYDYYYAAAVALNLDDDSEAERLIIVSIRQMNASKKFFLDFEEFDPFRSKKLFKKITDDYEKHQAVFFKNLAHPEIYREIDSMFIKDKKVRKNGGDMVKSDSLNINRLIEITKKYGWQSRGAWTILWHQRGSYGEDEKMQVYKPSLDSLIAIGKLPKDYWATYEAEKPERVKNGAWSFFKPYIDNQIANGKMRKDFWARYEDEKSIIVRRTQIYGTYWSWSQLEESPIEDIENVDKRRALVGMPPLWYMGVTQGIKLPDGYKPNKDYDSRNNWYNF